MNFFSGRWTTYVSTRGECENARNAVWQSRVLSSCNNRQASRKGSKHLYGRIKTKITISLPFTTYLSV